MKFTIVALGLLMMTFLMSHSGGRAAQHGEGNTGAPGDDAKTCATCHTGGNFGADIVISLTDSDGNEVDSYIGGETYTVAATFSTTTDPGGYGLQMVGLVDTDESNAGTFANQSANAQISSVGSRFYVEQAGLSLENVFSADWTAPEEGAGPVTFYAAGHAANGNGGNSGDQALNVAFNFTENIVESTVEFNTVDLEIYPNPVRDITNISFDEVVKGQMSIYDVNGKVLMNQSIQTNSISLDLSTFASGTYMLNIQTEEGITARQILKM